MTSSGRIIVRPALTSLSGIMRSHHTITSSLEVMLSSGHAVSWPCQSDYASPNHSIFCMGVYFVSSHVIVRPDRHQVTPSWFLQPRVTWYCHVSYKPCFGLWCVEQINDVTCHRKIASQVLLEARSTTCQLIGSLMRDLRSAMKAAQLLCCAWRQDLSSGDC